jgi:hypothetical protein
MDWLKQFDLRRWWIAAIAVGLVISLAAIAANNRDALLVGLGIISCGFGEWMNHRMETEIMRRGTLTTYPRVNRPIGLTLDGLGFMLATAGLYHILMA